MSDVFRDLRHSLRLLRRSPGFSAVAILVLAIGIGANTAVFSIVNTLLLRPRLGRIDQLSGVFSRDRTKTDSYRDFSYPAYVDLRDGSGPFESLMAHTFALVGIHEGESTRRSFSELVSSNYFATLGVPLASGRAFTAQEERPGSGIPVAIASYDVWKRASFSPRLLGSTVRVNATTFTVVGIAPRGFAGTMALISPEYWFPLGAYDLVVNDMFRQRDTGLDDRANHGLNLVGALKPGVSAATADAALDQIAKRLDEAYPGTDHNQTFLVAPVSRMDVSSRPDTGDPTASVSLLLMLMSGLVLVVACLNLANLMLAVPRAGRRSRSGRRSAAAATASSGSCWWKASCCRRLGRRSAWRSRRGRRSCWRRR